MHIEEFNPSRARSTVVRRKTQDCGVVDSHGDVKLLSM